MMPLRWDIFCQVIDNHGDLGVCWRLSADLASRGHAVRLWVDDASALAWMAPEGRPGITLHAWTDPVPPDGPADVVVEAFGCEIPTTFLAAMGAAQPKPPLWINLEYLSAEGYVERCHRLPSPVGSGPAAGLVRWFFYPGFTERTGGLLREPGLMERREQFDAQAWRAAHAPHASDAAGPERWISLFCYEPPALPWLLAQCTQTPTHLLVTPGRATEAVRQALRPIDDMGRTTHQARHENGLQPLNDKREQLSISYLAHCPQAAFDEMLWACDLNAVRGEDSVVRALWAGQALVWHIYPQHDNAHHDKLHAFLNWLQAPPSLRRFHAAWNGVDDTPLVLPDAATLAEWTACVQAARAKLLRQDDLVTQLCRFVREKQ